MKKIRKIKEAFFLILVMGVTSMCVFGCLAGTEKWQEEVQLSDGRVIIVDRELMFKRGGGEIVSNRSGTSPTEHRMSFTHPDESGKIIEWGGTKKSSMAWPELPLIFDLEAGQPIVYTSVGIAPSKIMYSKYIYQNDVWKEEELQETFTELTTNLYLGVKIDMPKYVDLETKRKVNKSVDYHRVFKKVGPKKITVAR